MAAPIWTPDLLTDLHNRYDKAVTWGIVTNRHRDWKTTRTTPPCPARRLRDKADQIWLWTINFAVPWTNNASERAL